MGYSPWDRKESDTTEQLTHTHTHIHMGVGDCMRRARALQDSEGERETAWAQPGGEATGQTLQRLPRSDSAWESRPNSRAAFPTSSPGKLGPCSASCKWMDTE